MLASLSCARCEPTVCVTCGALGEGRQRLGDERPWALAVVSSHAQYEHCQSL